MADEEQVRRLLDGVEGWNAWREESRGVWVDLRRADLTGAKLRGVSLEGSILADVTLKGSDLSSADFASANLSGANLEGAKLTGANLSSAGLFGANFSRANFSRANLSCAHLTRAYLGCANLRRANLIATDLGHADLSGANLFGADFREADLSGANLYRANLGDADLSGANLSGANLSDASLFEARFTSTSVAAVDISQTKGLAEVYHRGRSDISTSTLEQTAAGLVNAPPGRQAEVETFLRGAGVPEVMMHAFQSLIGMPIEFYSAFISYSHSDRLFADRLYADLQQRGIRCWQDRKDMTIGDPIRRVVNEAIRSSDRVILVCSLASLTSDWVNEELEIHFDKDRRHHHTLLPLDLDGYLFDGWEGAYAAKVRGRLAADFQGWNKDPERYAEQLEKVVDALRGTREEPEP